MLHTVFWEIKTDDLHRYHNCLKSPHALGYIDLFMATCGYWDFSMSVKLMEGL